VLQIAGAWILLVTGGGPTPDKPTVTFAPPTSPDVVSHELTFKVPDCRAAYEAVIRDTTEGPDQARTLQLLDELLWLPGDRMVQLAADTGFTARVQPISKRIWQHFYMFDLVLVADG